MLSGVVDPIIDFKHPKNKKKSKEKTVKHKTVILMRATLHYSSIPLFEYRTGDHVH